LKLVGTTKLTKYHKTDLFLECGDKLSREVSAAPLLFVSQAQAKAVSHGIPLATALQKNKNYAG
jgi:hypothetical protein